MTYIFSLGGSPADIVTSASISRKASDLTTTATINLPHNYLGSVHNLGEVAIEVNSKVLFHGVATDPSLTFSASGPSMSVQCVDLSYKLARMVVDPLVVTVYPADTDIGEIIYDLLADTGIDRSHINQSTGVTVETSFEITTGEFRLPVIQRLMKLYSVLFWLSYAKISGVYTTFGEFDTYTNMVASDEFTESHSITTSNIITFNLGLKTSSDMYCTRVIVIWENAGEYNIGSADDGTEGPFIDRVVKLNAGDADTETDLDAVAADYLTYYQTSVERIDMSFKDMSVGLFNLVDISGLSNIYGENIDLTSFRVTDITQNITSTGIVSSVQGVDPDAELWDYAIRGSTGVRHLGELMLMAAGTQAEEAKPVYATVIEEPT